ncbi:hypothetical protein Q1695_006137 [Nippostrongylus brasiliensis]|nr:hypothetical protein Q1695_006137 [Nippostrongylus brasiliensis]
MRLLIWLAAMIVNTIQSSPPYVFTTGDVLRCFRMYNNISNSMLAVGITPNCYLFYGSLRNIRSPRSRSLELHSPPGLETACKDKQAYIVRSYGDAQMMMIVVDRFGRRVRVQPALSKRPKYTKDQTGHLIYHYVNPKNRLGQFYSGNVDLGFTIGGFFYHRFRVLVYAVSHYVVRLYELRLEIGHNFITPYLKPLATPLPSLALPSMEIKIHFTKNNLYDGEQVLISRGKEAIIAHISAIVTGDITTVRRATEGDYESFHVTGINSIAALLCPNFDSVALFHSKVAQLDSDVFVLEMSTRRWVNPLHAHRRMSYPHAIRRMVRHQFFSKGWARALPIVAANVVILLVGTLVFLRLVGYYNREYNRRHLSLSHTFSITG